MDFDLLGGALTEALSRAVTFRGLGLVLIGTLYGVLLGVLPGVSGAMGLILLIPVTFGWQLDDALLLLGATWGGNAFAGSIVAILLGVPGDAVNAMTVTDGFPLAKQGRGVEALSAAAVASALGATIGIGFLILSIPFLRQIVLLFGPAEFFALGLIGVAVIATISGGATEKGLISGVLGLLFGLHGTNVVTGHSRFDFGVVILQDGIPLLPVFIGVFAFGHAVHLFRHEDRIAKLGSQVTGGVRDILKGASAVFRNFGLFLRSVFIGLVIGATPGPGATLATFLAYGQATRTAKPPRLFGQGDIRGVIAPEAANDAKDGAALMPTVAFGVPGTISTGVILLSFQFHGVRTGPTMLGPELPTLFVLLFGLFAANILSSVLGVSASRLLVKITSIPTSVIAPAVLVFAVVGGLANRGAMIDVGMVVAFGALGYLFRVLGFPAIPLVIALLLSSLIETSLGQAYQIGGNSYGYFLERPIALTLLVLAVVIMVLPIFKAAYSHIRNRGAYADV